MSAKKKQEIRFSLDSPVVTVTNEPKTILKRTKPQTDKQEEKVEKSEPPTPPLPPPPPKLLPYVPPDALMSALFSAIQRKTWIRARRLCYELILCDPTRKTYRDLFYLIDNLIKISDQRVRTKHVTQRVPTVVASRPTSASNSSSDDDLEV